MIIACILAGGTGTRAGLAMPKQFYPLKGAPVLARTLSCFETHPAIDRIILAVHPEWFQEAAAIVHKYNFIKVSKITGGGSVRQDSSRLAVEEAAPDKDDIILIHDAARPFVSHDLISRVIAAAQKAGAAVPAIEATDTVIETGPEGEIIRYPDRSNIMLCQTPQGFRASVIIEAHRAALKNGTMASDDSGLVFFMGKSLIRVQGSGHNIKLTRPDDFPAAELLLLKGYEFLLDPN